MSNPLYERAVSAFPLSIGTSLALESIFIGRQDPYDPERVAPVKIEISQYNDMLINVDTLIRNILSSVTSEVMMSLSSNDVIEILLQEMEMILDIFNVEGNGVVTPVFYIRDYDKVKKEFNKKIIKFREPKTARQLKIAALHKDTLLNFEKPELKYNVSHVSKHLTDKTLGKTIIITHYAVDLLDRSRFSDLELLESNTGDLKRRDRWYTKYYAGNSLSNIPFQRRLLSIFGDNDFITPMPIKVRQQIIDIANNHNWSSVTTELKVSNDISLYMADRYFATIFTSL